MSTDFAPTPKSADFADPQKHYAKVAQEILDALPGDAVCGRSSCCEPPAQASELRANGMQVSEMRASEAASLYDESVREALPLGALAASRGCGDPVAKAELKEGERVLDLGSGGGIDALIAAQTVGESGHVFGVDMTPEMIELAQKNAADVGFSNVEFIQGTIEDLPLEDASVDVVLSNCVINFSDDKPRVMREAARVLVEGGRFVVSDIVSFAPIPERAYEPLCRIVGCTKGMQPQEDYRAALLAAGFSDVRIEPKTVYTLEVLRKKAEQKDRLAFFTQIEDDERVSGASGSVIIYAVK